MNVKLGFVDPLFPEQQELDILTVYIYRHYNCKINCSKDHITGKMRPYLDKYLYDENLIKARIQELENIKLKWEQENDIGKLYGLY